MIEGETIRRQCKMPKSFFQKIGPRLDAALLVVPVTAWLLHVGWLVPRLSTSIGEGKLHLAFGFFMVAGASMLICSAWALYRLWFPVYLRQYYCVALLLNSSWLYYVKVMFLGPTIGAF